MYLFQSCVPAGTTPITGASAMSFVVNQAVGEREMVLPTSQPPGLRCVRALSRNAEGESMCSRTSKTVIISYFFFFFCSDDSEDPDDPASVAVAV